MIFVLLNVVICSYLRVFCWLITTTGSILVVLWCKKCPILAIFNFGEGVFSGYFLYIIYLRECSRSLHFCIFRVVKTDDILRHFSECFYCSLPSYFLLRTLWFWVHLSLNVKIFFRKDEWRFFSMRSDELSNYENYNYVIFC